ncbi:hypothetical protein LUZ63_017749 [Rhynchospora breviuscula]|uniref:FAR1 domain-containing protein n=1 Tax=Rhynchospora breviuscula TaxID=2022672 RepID=A0A9Q0C339_9POAL|nr:hypothetical protein LUZ63_017749 [Rhynchospora breviuscula]
MSSNSISDEVLLPSVDNEESLNVMELNEDIAIGESESKRNEASNTNHSDQNTDGLKIFKGMIFTSLEEAEELYKAFAKANGFTVRIRNTHAGWRGSISIRQFVCSCQGFYVEKKEKELSIAKEKDRRTLTRRCGCEAMLVVKWDKKKNVWIAHKFTNDHNHNMVSPQSKCYLISNKCMPAMAKNLVEKFNEIGLPIGKVPTIFGDMEGVNFNERDCYNHMRDKRRKDLVVGMNTTQRSESMHSFFDSFVNNGTTLREFVMKYEKALECRYLDEKDEQYVSKYKFPTKVKSPLELHGAKEVIYDMGMDTSFHSKSEDSSLVLRNMIFYRMVNHLSSYLDASKETYQLIINSLEETFNKVVAIEGSSNIKSLEEPLRQEVNDDAPLQDPAISRRKGRKKESAKVSRKENIQYSQKNDTTRDEITKFNYITIYTSKTSHSIITMGSCSSIVDSWHVSG